MTSTVLTFSSSATPDPAAHDMQLICDGERDTALCRAFAAAIAAEFGAVGFAEAPAEGLTCLRFVTERQGRDVLSGHLVRQGACGAQDTGPTLTLSVSDAGVNDAMLGGFAAEVLRTSRLRP